MILRNKGAGARNYDNGQKGKTEYCVNITNSNKDLLENISLK